MTAFNSTARIKFTQSAGTDVAANRVRFHAVGTTPDKSMPFDEVKPAPAADADGFTYIPVASLASAAKIEGQTDIAVTAVDSAGNESDFLDITDVVLDMVPPPAPTDGSVV
jgi:hypothetical protein